VKNHRVEFVDDAALPDGTDWVLAREGDVNFLFVRESATLGDVLSEAWVAFHAQTDAAPVVVRQRQAVKASALVVGMLAFALQPWVTTETLAAADFSGPSAVLRQMAPSY